jgi:hypothetical protein
LAFEHVGSLNAREFRIEFIDIADLENILLIAAFGQPAANPRIFRPLSCATVKHAPQPGRSCGLGPAEVGVFETCSILCQTLEMYTFDPIKV